LLAETTFIVQVSGLTPNQDFQGYIYYISVNLFN
jgi:hypothetical protein